MTTDHSCHGCDVRQDEDEMIRQMAWIDHPEIHNFRTPEVVWFCVRCDRKRFPDASNRNATDQGAPVITSVS